ncbi:MAG: hypothetical protein K8F91_15395 [Candidatus Obscuribacterales bacterium]|nr:hypothetical protein [Candidatus Obscuribacterales bacterium]
MTRHIRIAKGVGIVSSVCLFLASSSAAYGAQSWQDNLRSFFSLPGGARTVSGPEKLDLRSTRKMSFF